MTRRSKRSQTAHDTEVQWRARELERKGWKVKADVQGFPQPGTIGGYRPDYVASKGRERIIGEVETTESLDDKRAQGQERTFQGAADRRSTPSSSSGLWGRKRSKGNAMDKKLMSGALLVPVVITMVNGGSPLDAGTITALCPGSYNIRCKADATEGQRQPSYPVPTGIMTAVSSSTAVGR